MSATIYHYYINLSNPVLTLHTAKFNLHKLYVVLALLCVLCADLKTNSNLYLIHH